MFSISTHTLTHFGLPISNLASGLYRPLSLSVFVDTSCLHSLRAAHFKSKLKTLCPGEVLPNAQCQMSTTAIQPNQHFLFKSDVFFAYSPTTAVLDPSLVIIYIPKHVARPIHPSIHPYILKKIPARALQQQQQQPQ